MTVKELLDTLTTMDKLIIAAKRTIVDPELADWTDRAGDYQKDIGMVQEACGWLLEDYAKRMVTSMMEKTYHS